MREIKFRLTYHNKIVGYERHEYNRENDHITILHNEYNIEAVEDAEIQHDNKDQFTGLKDKNVWEDDVITFIPIDGSTEKRQTARVYYCEKRAAFCVKSKAWDCPLSFCKNIEIIGNIHENPALMKKGT